MSEVKPFRNLVSREAGALYPPEAGRYHLYVSLTCPWAHRALIVRKLKGLENIISLSQVAANTTDDRGWLFTEQYPDPNNADATRLKDLYLREVADYEPRATVPTLYDKKTKKIVNAESAEIIRFFNSEFNDLIEDPEKKKLDLLDPKLQPQIDEWNDFVLASINFGIYKVGLAKSQSDYDVALKNFFGALDKLEEQLKKSDGEYLLGKQITEVDVKLYPTIIRFDVAYHLLHRANVAYIRYGYPHLDKWLRNLYWKDPAFKESTDFDIIKTQHFSNKTFNPSQIIPGGPVPDILPLDA